MSTSFKEQIAPFRWVDHDNKRYSVCLDVGGWKDKIFESRRDEGFEGNGYDWGSLALVFLEEMKPSLKEFINFDPEGSMFCVYSSNADALKEFAVSFKEACEDEALINDLFSRAELD